jgi:hypothetical protein
MSLAAQKQRLLQQVSAILIATTKTFCKNNNDNYDDYISLICPKFPSISVDGWKVVGAAFVDNRIFLIDERELQFSVDACFDSSDQDNLLEIVDALHAKGLSSSPEKSQQYCELLREHNDPALTPVTVVFHQNDQHLSTDETELGSLQPDALRQMLLKQGAGPFDETQPVEFSICNLDDPDTELVSGAIHPAFIAQ